SVVRDVVQRFPSGVSGMASFPYLDLAIAICFIYLLMALVCSTVNESIAGVFNSRGKTLEKGISALLQDPALKQKLYEHPLIQGIKQDDDGRLPSYIASNKFALALMDTLTGPAAADNAVALRDGIIRRSRSSQGIHERQCELVGRDIRRQPAVVVLLYALDQRMLVELLLES